MGSCHDECVRHEENGLGFEVYHAVAANHLSGVLGPEAWRPPVGMKGQIHAFDPREGTFRMSFASTETDHSVRGKISQHANVFHGRFVKLVPNRAHR